MCSVDDLCEVSQKMVGLSLLHFLSDDVLFEHRYSFFVFVYQFLHLSCHLGTLSLSHVPTSTSSA